MFNSTHTLVGLGMARCGLERWAPRAVWTAVIAASLPDIDLIAQFNGAASYITYHRGITHSVPGIVVLSLLLGWAMHGISPGFRGHFAVALLVMATHPALDFLNTYGIRPLFPLGRRWIYGDILFVIDPYADLALAAGLFFAWRAPQKRKLAGAVGLAVMLGYIGLRLELRNLAHRQLQSLTAELPGFVSSAVSPRMLNPLTWTGIVETKDDVFSVDVDAFQGVGLELARFRKGDDSVAVAAARNTPGAAALLAFARFPVVQTQTTTFGYRVEFIDFRFYREETGTALASIVDLNRTLQVLRESTGFNERVSPVTPSASTNGSP
jgi:inner membrane protein